MKQALPWNRLLVICLCLFWANKTTLFMTLKDNRFQGTMIIFIKKSCIWRLPIGNSRTWERNKLLPTINSHRDVLRNAFTNRLMPLYSFSIVNFFNSVNKHSEIKGCILFYSNSHNPWYIMFIVSWKTLLWIGVMTMLATFLKAHKHDQLALAK